MPKLPAPGPDLTCDPEHMPDAISEPMRAWDGIKRTSHNLLGRHGDLLMNRGETEVRETANHLKVRLWDTFKITGRLAEEGLVEMADDRRDKRETLVWITPTGVTAFTKVIKGEQATGEKMSKLLTRDAQAKIVASLIECQSHIRNRLKRFK